MSLSQPPARTGYAGRTYHGGPVSDLPVSLLAEADLASPEEWRDLLLDRMAGREGEVRKRMRYYSGDHVLPSAPRGAREAFQRFLRISRTNWCRLIVDAVAERLRVTGFRFGDDAADDDAWLVWKANGMDADHEVAQNDALVCGSSFVLVWPDEDTPTGVRLSVEHTLQMTVAYEPGNRRRRIAGLKTYLDVLAGLRYAWLATPGVTYLWSRAATHAEIDDGTLEPRTHQVEAWELVDVAANPMGQVPVVELRPWPRTLGPGWSELDGGVIDIQDRINATLFNRMMASEYAAFRQKWATGLILPTRRDPVTGEETLDANGNPIPIEPFDSAVDHLWVAENPQVRFGEFSESDLTGYIKAVESDVQHLAAITHTPPHYLLGQIINASGDALKAAEAGLVAKVRFRAAHLGEAWEDVMRLAFAALGSERSIEVEGEVLWADFETRSEAEHVDALVKLASIGVPRTVLWERAGASPQEVKRWQAEAVTENLLAGAPLPLTTPVVPGAGQPG
jgi:Phage portal protein, SPP1 Gp6-like